MPTNLRKRKGASDSSDLPSTVSRPKPELNESGHASKNRQGPTIAPTVFIFLIVGLLVILPPIFYFTQVMIPDPESTSTLSQFRIKGNILLNALGHSSSSGIGRFPFSPQPHLHSNLKSHGPVASSPDLSQTNSRVDHQENPQVTLKNNEDVKETSPIISTPTPSISIVTSTEEVQKVIKDKEEEQKLDEELGKFWEASSRYRKEAQKQKSGEYSLQGDGTVEGSNKSNSDENGGADLDLDDLPPADPDAIHGLTPEFWNDFKHLLSADDLTLVLNDLRQKEILLNSPSNLNS